jgi:hypothetical protein
MRFPSRCQQSVAWNYLILERAKSGDSRGFSDSPSRNGMSPGSEPIGDKRGCGLVAALATAIQVSPERRRAAVLNGEQHAQVQPR